MHRWGLLTVHLVKTTRWALLQGLCKNCAGDPDMHQMRRAHEARSVESRTSDRGRRNRSEVARPTDLKETNQKEIVRLNCRPHHKKETADATGLRRLQDRRDSRRRLITSAASEQSFMKSVCRGGPRYDGAGGTPCNNEVGKRGLSLSRMTNRDLGRGGAEEGSAARMKWARPLSNDETAPALIERTESRKSRDRRHGGAPTS
ncbi:uncharacterized protein UBRO_20237 [Ustilago bromivora]|uniref:Uncharacterized protein n=1 Tax=Ustilago bromivora TaxID=307758 RepID=A0A1K0G833_9BASI|nr:uncharacterized protein UBRO_20237 [Ustilago bromivora]